ncbi:MAG: D-alanyl-D-alanine carboxypeptidase/D-alanyl-D-alanine-endopeptidase [Lautropia sp.]
MHQRHRSTSTAAPRSLAIGQSKRLRHCAAAAAVAVLVFVGVAVAPGAASAQDDIAESIQDALAAAGIRAEDYGLVVRPLGSMGLTLDHNPDVPFNPASTMKLVTTHAAIGLLGVDYRWVTSVYTNGRVEDGTLYGDLVIKGGGDPKLVIEDLTEIVSKLRAGGLEHIKGDLLIDDSMYEATADRTPAFDGGDTQPYNVAPYAALVNFKATRFILDPRRRRVTLDPPLADVAIENRVKVFNGRCRRKGNGVHIEEAGTEAKPVIRLVGAVVGACGEQNFYASVLSHRQFVHGLFKAAWTAAGGRLDGTTRIVPGAGKGEPYYQWHSPRTLADVVRDVNKFSNNVMARMLMLQLGAQIVHQPASVDHGRSIVRQFYGAKKLPMRSLVLENGSGLSREERISASDLTEVLLDAARGPAAATFEASLPQVGIDGTMRLRLRRDPVAGKAFVKTGTLNHVKAIAGYVTASSGLKYAVTLLINGPRAERAGKAQDALLRWVYQNG